MRTMPIALLVLLAGLSGVDTASAQEARTAAALATAPAAPSILLSSAVPQQVAAAPTIEPRLDLDLRIAHAQERYARNRTLGTGLLAVGGAAVVGALVDWAGTNQLGMEGAAAGAMVGGMSFVVWGADRHRAASRWLEEVRTLEAATAGSGRP